jgi:hypothetical protein
MAGKPTSRDSARPSFRKDRVERGQEADDTRPLYAADAIHSTEEAKFSLDSDGPVGGPVPDVRSPLDEADELARQGRGLTESEEEDEETRES